MVIRSAWRPWCSGRSPTAATNCIRIPSAARAWRRSPAWTSTSARCCAWPPETVAYSYRQKMAWKSRARDITVDADARRIRSTDKDRDYSPPYRPGVLDRNAITVALMADVAAGKPGDLRYYIPSKDELEPWVYRAGAVERVRTALGNDEAVRVERIRESANGRTTTLWLGKSRNYVPLRILQKEPNGETIEMTITSLK